jgi:hypothetical protein
MSKPEFVYVIYIEAPQQRVWDALTTGEDTVHFWSRYVQSDWKQGSRVEFLRADKSKLTMTAKCWKSIRPIASS